MFDNLGNRLDDIFRKLRSRGRLTEKEIDEALREIRVALLEADVALPAVRTFLQHVKAEALGEEVLKSLTPGQQVIKIVHEELVRMLGGKTVGLASAPKPPTIILLAGLQGSGKTSTAAKLASLLRRKGEGGGPRRDGPERSGGRCRTGAGGGPAGRGCRHPRHRRPAARRSRDDGPGGEGPRRRPAA